VRTNLLLTFLLLTPLMLGVGIVATFKIAGPLHNFEQFLRAVRDGQQVEPCQIRKGDELQTLCTLLNEVTAPLRERAASNSGSPRAHDVDDPRPAIPSERREAAEKSSEKSASEQRHSG
jgi:nitrogen fixation/metabolism regulation signal transduction histidine kinase